MDLAELVPVSGIMVALVWWVSSRELSSDEKSSYFTLTLIGSDPIYNLDYQTKEILVAQAKRDGLAFSLLAQPDLVDQAITL